MANEDQFGRSSGACLSANTVVATIGAGKKKKKLVRITNEVNKLFDPVLSEVRKYLGRRLTPVEIKMITELFFNKLLDTESVYENHVKLDALRCHVISKKTIDLLYLLRSAYTDIENIINPPKSAKPKYVTTITAVLAYYIDLELKASHRRVEEVRDILNRITRILESQFQCLDDSVLLDVFLCMKKIDKIYCPYIRTIFGKYLAKPLREKPRETCHLQFVKYAYLFKKWQSIELIDEDKDRVADYFLITVKPEPTFWEIPDVRELMNDTWTEENRQLRLLETATTNLLLNYIKQHDESINTCPYQRIRRVSTIDQDVRALHFRRRLQVQMGTSRSYSVPTIIESIDLTGEELTTPVRRLEWLTSILEQARDSSISEIIIEKMNNSKKIPDFEDDISNAVADLGVEEAKAINNIPSLLADCQIDVESKNVHEQENNGDEKHCEELLENTLPSVSSEYGNEILKTPALKDETQNKSTSEDAGIRPISQNNTATDNPVSVKLPSIDYKEKATTDETAAKGNSKTMQPEGIDNFDEETFSPVKVELIERLIDNFNIRSATSVSEAAFENGELPEIDITKRSRNEISLLTTLSLEEEIFGSPSVCINAIQADMFLQISKKIPAPDNNETQDAEIFEIMSTDEITSIPTNPEKKETSTSKGILRPITRDPRLFKSIDARPLSLAPLEAVGSHAQNSQFEPAEILLNSVRVMKHDEIIENIITNPETIAEQMDAPAADVIQTPEDENGNNGRKIADTKHDSLSSLPKNDLSLSSFTTSSDITLCNISGSSSPVFEGFSNADFTPFHKFVDDIYSKKDNIDDVEKLRIENAEIRLKISKMQSKFVRPTDLISPIRDKEDYATTEDSAISMSVCEESTNIEEKMIFECTDRAKDTDNDCSFVNCDKFSDNARFGSEDLDDYPITRMPINCSISLNRIKYKHLLFEPITQLRKSYKNECKLSKETTNYFKKSSGIFRKLNMQHENKSNHLLHTADTRDDDAQSHSDNLQNIVARKLNYLEEEISAEIEDVVSKITPVVEKPKKINTKSANGKKRKTLPEQISLEKVAVKKSKSANGRKRKTLPKQISLEKVAVKKSKSANGRKRKTLPKQISLEKVAVEKSKSANGKKRKTLPEQISLEKIAVKKSKSANGIKRKTLPEQISLEKVAVKKSKSANGIKRKTLPIQISLEKVAVIIDAIEAKKRKEFLPIEMKIGDKIDIPSTILKAAVVKLVKVYLPPVDMLNGSASTVSTEEPNMSNNATVLKTIEEALLEQEEEALLEQEERAPQGEEAAMLEEEAALLAEEEALLKEGEALLGDEEAMLKEVKDLLVEEEALLEEEEEALLVEEEGLLEQEEEALLGEEAGMLAEEGALLKEREALLVEEDALLEQEVEALRGEEKAMLEEEKALLVVEKPLLKEDEDLLAEVVSLLEQEEEALLGDEEAILEEEEEALLRGEEAMLEEEEALLKEGEALLAEEKCLLEQEEEALLGDEEAMLEEEEEAFLKEELALLLEEEALLEQEEEALLGGEEAMLTEEEDLLVEEEALLQEGEALQQEEVEDLQQEEEALCQEVGNLELQTERLLSEEAPLQEKALLPEQASRNTFDSFQKQKSSFVIFAQETTPQNVSENKANQGVKDPIIVYNHPSIASVGSSKPIQNHLNTVDFIKAYSTFLDNPELIFEQLNQLPNLIWDMEDSNDEPIDLSCFKSFKSNEATSLNSNRIIESSNDVVSSTQGPCADLEKTSGNVAAKIVPTNQRSGFPEPHQDSVNKQHLDYSPLHPILKYDVKSSTQAFKRTNTSANDEIHTNFYNTQQFKEARVDILTGSQFTRPQNPIPSQTEKNLRETPDFSLSTDKGIPQGTVRQYMQERFTEASTSRTAETPMQLASSSPHPERHTIPSNVDCQRIYLENLEREKALLSKNKEVAVARYRACIENVVKISSEMEAQVHLPETPVAETITRTPRKRKVDNNNTPNNRHSSENTQSPTRYQLNANSVVQIAQSPEYYQGQHMRRDENISVPQLPNQSIANNPNMPRCLSNNPNTEPNIPNGNNKSPCDARTAEEMNQNIIPSTQTAESSPNDIADYIHSFNTFIEDMNINIDSFGSEICDINDENNFINYIKFLISIHKNNKLVNGSRNQNINNNRNVNRKCKSNMLNNNHNNGNMSNPIQNPQSITPFTAENNSCTGGPMQSMNNDKTDTPNNGNCSYSKAKDNNVQSTQNSKINSDNMNNKSTTTTLPSSSTSSYGADSPDPEHNRYAVKISRVLNRLFVDNEQPASSTDSGSGSASETSLPLKKRRRMTIDTDTSGHVIDYLFKEAQEKEKTFERTNNSIKAATTVQLENIRSTTNTAEKKENISYPPAPMMSFANLENPYLYVPFIHRSQMLPDIWPPFLLTPPAQRLNTAAAAYLNSTVSSSTSTGAAAATSIPPSGAIFPGYSITGVSSSTSTDAAPASVIPPYGALSSTSTTLAPSTNPPYGAIFLGYHNTRVSSSTPVAPAAAAFMNPHQAYQK